MLSDLISKDDGVQRILVAPLNWGLGHATRMIPLIQHCLDLGKQVALASDGIAIELLQKEFPQLKAYQLPPYNIRYSKSYTGLKILAQAPKIARVTRLENQITTDIVSEFRPDLIVSDNRLGVRHPDVRSVVVTHQVALISPSQLVTPIARKINRWYLNQFDSVWIMDHPDRRLSGHLSNPEGLHKHQTLGVLTRLTPSVTPPIYSRQVLIILSGPEPQRTLLEDKLLKVLTNSNFTFTLVRGTNTPLSSKWTSVVDKENIYHLAETQLLNDLINTSEAVITRTGYTSVMDLDVLQKKAILIPTPNQPEQEYLGKHLAQHPLFTILSQANVESNLELLLEEKLN